MNDFTKYEQMRDRGASLKDVYLAAKQDNLNPIEQLSVVRRVFNLSFEQAKEVSVIAENLAQSLSEYQLNFKSAIEKLAEEDEE